MENAPIEPVVFEQHGKIVANSRDVAAFFQKNHHHVLRDIRKLIALRPELNRTNFGLVELPDEKGELRPAYDMDRDGFALLAMGFTGEKALEFKLRYIGAFNTMEQTLAAPPHPTIEPPVPGAERPYPGWPAELWRLKIATIDRYDRCYGKFAAQWRMKEEGFPVPPKHLITEGRQIEMFETITITRGAKPPEEE